MSECVGWQTSLSLFLSFFFFFFFFVWFLQRRKRFLTCLLFFIWRHPSSSPIILIIILPSLYLFSPFRLHSISLSLSLEWISFSLSFSFCFLFLLLSSISSHLPIAVDKPIFLRLIEDLFPGIEAPSKRDVEFWRAVTAVTKAQKLQAEEQFILKCVQLKEILSVRTSSSSPLSLFFLFLFFFIEREGVSLISLSSSCWFFSHAIQMESISLDISMSVCVSGLLPPSWCFSSGVYTPPPWPLDLSHPYNRLKHGISSSSICSSTLFSFSFKINTTFFLYLYTPSPPSSFLLRLTPATPSCMFCPFSCSSFVFFLFFFSFASPPPAGSSLSVYFRTSRLRQIPCVGDAS